MQYKQNGSDTTQEQEYLKKWKRLLLLEIFRLNITAAMMLKKE